MLIKINSCSAIIDVVLGETRPACDRGSHFEHVFYVMSIGVCNHFIRVAIRRDIKGFCVANIAQLLMFVLFTCTSAGAAATRGAIISYYFDASYLFNTHIIYRTSRGSRIFATARRLLSNVSDNLCTILQDQSVYCITDSSRACKHTKIRNPGFWDHNSL